MYCAAVAWETIRDATCLSTSVCHQIPTAAAVTSGCVTLFCRNEPSPNVTKALFHSEDHSMACFFVKTLKMKTMDLKHLQSNCSLTGNTSKGTFKGGKEYFANPSNVKRPKRKINFLFEILLGKHAFRTARAKAKRKGGK